MKFIYWKLNTFKVIGGEKFHGGRDHETIFLKHISKSLFGGKNLFGVVMAEIFDFAIWVDFFE